MAIPLFLALLSVPLVRGDASTYRDNAICSNDQLMRWYNADSGVWTNTDGSLYWWQSANMLSAFNDLAMLDGGPKDHYSSVWESTFNNAPASNPSPSVKKRFDGKLEKFYTERTAEEIQGRKMMKRADVGFTNDFYDDEGWWALAWLGARDASGDIKYLNEAIDIWYDMNAGWNTGPCGGLPWNKYEGTAPVAIANELYIQLGAALANHVGDDQKQTYLGAAQDAWAWFQSVNLINGDGLVNDGVDATTCQNDGEPTYSYNQGVIIGGLVELYHATNDGSYLDAAAGIADAVTTPGSSMLNENGILVDQCDRDLSCSGDGEQFKGVFARNLKLLQAVRPSDQWRGFLETNAQSIWNNDGSFVDGNCMNGNYWGGPYVTADASTQGSALDCLVAALAVTA